MSTNVFCWLLIIIINVLASDLNWRNALSELQQTKAKWKHNGVNSYAYQITRTSDILPFPCEKAPKYVLVKNNVVDHVEYDAKYLQSQHINCQGTAIDLVEYYTIDEYYDMAINLAIEGIIDNCNVSDPSRADTYGGSILFEYNKILFYPTRLRFILPQVGNEYPLNTFTCLTVYDSSPWIQNFGNECNEFIALQPEQCKITQDECSLHNECCNGICSKSQWDKYKSVCCYDDQLQNSLCRNDFDCCNGYACDDNTNLCIQQTKVMACGTSKNSGANKLIKCKWNDDCCDGYKCNQNNKRCVPRYNYGLTSNWFGLDEFDETKIYWLLMNLCVMMVICCYNVVCRKTQHKMINIDQSDYNQVDIEAI